MSRPAEIVTADDIECGVEVDVNPAWMVEDNIIEAPTPSRSTTASIASASTASRTVTGVVVNDDTIAAPVLHREPKVQSASPTMTTTDNNNTNNNNTTNNTAARIASQKTWRQYFHDTWNRDGRVLVIALIIIICMNIPYVKWILYPFTIFSTWIHELCHGMAAIVTGGSISKLMIYPDTSGLAYTAANPKYRGWIASAGYQGTAIIGCVLLLCRRTKRGPRSGTMILALVMILSACIWIRNVFGFFFTFIFGVLLVGCAWKLPSQYIRDVYVILAITCSLNAITSVHGLFASGTYMVNGTESQTSDAHTMSDVVGGSYILWALLWFCLAIILTLVGVIFAIPGPDEVADFQCCGICQDCGCFTLINYPGQRCFQRIWNKQQHNNTADTTTTGANTNTDGDRDNRLGGA